MLHGAGNYERKEGEDGKALSTIKQKFTFSLKIDASKFKKEDEKK